MFKVFANTLESTTLEQMSTRALRAEQMGYHGIQVPDALHDGLLLSALALQATQKLIVSTGVLVAFPRSPMITAVAAWDLARMSGGRFELGLGTQVKANIEKRYAARWDSPVPQLREYIEAIRAIFHSFQTGEKLNFVGDHYQLTKLQPFFNPGPIDHPNIPIIAGAVGPDMTKMVGRIADGVITHPTNTPPEYIEQVFWPRLKQGLSQAGKTGDEFSLLLSPLCATGIDDAAVDAAWEQQRSMLSFLFSTPAYWPTLELFGWQDKGEALLAMTRSGDWSQMSTIMSDDVLEKVLPRGRYDEIAAIYKQRFSHLSDRITFPMPEDPAEDEAVADVIRQLSTT